MIIQKFGGIAMQSETTRKHCILHIANALKTHGKTLIVVSAMGRNGDAYATDTLLTITKAFQDSSKSKDLVAACGEMIAAAVISAELQAEGIANELLYGSAIGIEATSDFGDAEIIGLKPAVLNQAFENHSCVVVPGFQGTNASGEIVTLGRGGSDLTAAVLGAALHAQYIEFYKDVPGVMTGNPKVNSAAQLISELSYTEFHKLLDDPHPIVQKKAAEMAEQHHLTLHIRNIFTLEKGTFILPSKNYGATDESSVL